MQPWPNRKLDNFPKKSPCQVADGDAGNGTPGDDPHVLFFPIREA